MNTKNLRTKIMDSELLGIPLIVIICLSSLIGLGALAAITWQRDIPASGISKDATLTFYNLDDTPLVILNFGQLEKSRDYYQSMKIKNVGNVAVTLSIQTVNLDSHLGLTWNYVGATLAPDSTITTIFHLTTSADLPLGTIFSWTIRIIAAEAV